MPRRFSAGIVLTADARPALRRRKARQDLPSASVGVTVIPTSVAGTGAPRSGASILVVDDEHFMLKLLCRTLSSLGQRDVQPCASGPEALAHMERSGCPPGLILCDLHMPDMDGVEFVRELVARRYTGSLILVSGDDDRVLLAAQRLVQAHDIEVLGCLHKPVTPEALRNLLAHWAPNAAPRLRVAMPAYPPDQVRRAIVERQLLNHYQPKVSLASGRVVGIEALVRWQHPRDGLVYPDQFISVAEDHGLIDELTDCVLTAALRHAAGWNGMGLPLKVAINVSMDSLSRLDYPDIVAQHAADADIAPHAVILEVTESRLMHDLRMSLDVLTRLRLRHFQLSIDDFGTGHSSLSQLRDMPFTEMKIDRSFVHGAHNDPTLRAIYEASSSLARSMGMTLVAEGVEDRADWDFLRASGCQTAQGYFIAKPMPASALATWILEWEQRVAAEGLLAELLGGSITTTT